MNQFPNHYSNDPKATEKQKQHRPFTSLTSNKEFYKSPSKLENTKVFSNPMKKFDFYSQEKKFGVNNNKYLETRELNQYKHDIISGEVKSNVPWNFDRFNYQNKTKRIHSSNKTYIRNPNTNLLYDPITNRYMNNTQSGINCNSSGNASDHNMNYSRKRAQSAINNLY
mmetsp:Transcript_805/g.788  ORF Transcript_805/g.788 Transcript_805/m.788 type:complete len:168 (+) Transcript_805:54-557(+)